MKELYVQYGCGHSAPKEWLNFDVSPTLRIQKIPLIGSLVKSQLNTTFPNNVKYGNIIKGLPIPSNSCNGIYCSHTLEHLSLTDFRTALKNTYKVLKNDGIFRCIVPDLEYEARSYINSLDNKNAEASIDFLNNTLLGIKERPKGLKGFISSFFGNSAHLWMWDSLSFTKELEKAGFKDIQICSFNDSKIDLFKQVEDEDRFVNAVAIECKK
jgi:hypothetical protein